MNLDITMNPYINQLFDLTNKHVVVTGAGGHLCGAMASDAASAITSQNINVDCGVLPQ